MSLPLLLSYVQGTVVCSSPVMYVQTVLACVVSPALPSQRTVLPDETPCTRLKLLADFLPCGNAGHWGVSVARGAACASRGERRVRRAGSGAYVGVGAVNGVREAAVGRLLGRRAGDGRKHSEGGDEKHVEAA